MQLIDVNQHQASTLSGAGQTQITAGEGGVAAADTGV